MRSEIGARLRSAMAQHGVERGLVLSMNGLRSCTRQAPAGRCWTRALSHVERPVAVVLADDEHPHLFMPFSQRSLLGVTGSR